MKIGVSFGEFGLLSFVSGQIRAAFLIVCCFFSSAVIANEANSTAVTENIVLTVELADGQAIVFDMEMLQALETTTFVTSTPWFDSVREFAGVSLKDLFDAIGAPVVDVEAVALNDYFATIPTEQILTGDPMIAYAIDGEFMSVREKGPLWVVYPYDLNPDYQTDSVYNRSVWQLYLLREVQ